jgi:monoamine oxidase
VIITVPIPILKAKTIEFIPAFDSDRLDTIQSIDAQPAVLITLRFSERPWPASMSHAQIGCGNEPCPDVNLMDSEDPSSGVVCICALLIAADHARFFMGKPKEESVKVCLD